MRMTVGDINMLFKCCRCHFSYLKPDYQTSKFFDIEGSH